jgi:phosphatidate cytidylyltransferase
VNTVVKRVLITVTGIPLILSIIFFLPHLHYLAFLLVGLVFTYLGTKEVRALLLNTGQADRIAVLPVMATLIPVAAHLQIFYLPAFPLVEILIIILVSFTALDEIITGGGDDFSRSMVRIGFSLITLMYPGMFVLYLVRLTAFTNAGWFIVLLFLLIFSNDVFAYIFGMLFGRSSQNIVRVSPKKSAVGFIGGAVMTVAIGYTFLALIPQIFTARRVFVELALFLMISLTANIGDLIESVLKRAARAKDSGGLMPGRGGIMDSIDSIVFSAPFFYFFLLMMQTE